MKTILKQKTDERLDDLQLHLPRLQVAIEHPLHHLPEAMSLGLVFEITSEMRHSVGIPIKKKKKKRMLRGNGRIILEPY